MSTVMCFVANKNYNEYTNAKESKYLPKNTMNKHVDVEMIRFEKVF